MTAWEIIDNAATRDGADLLLARTGDRWEIHTGYRMLMSSELHESEEALAQLALERVPAATRVLLGGLGLGFTLRVALDRLAPEARVVLAETSAALIRWNRTHLGVLAGNPLDDPRVVLHQGDVRERIGESSASYDVILLDVDNGPTALVHSTNSRLYDDEGARACHSALRPGGVLAVWSAHPDESYELRLQRAGFETEVIAVPAGDDEGTEHVIFLAAISR